MTPIKVTLILFSYNHARFLAEACNSISRQTRPPDEIILCDDGSTDCSREILSSFASRLPSTMDVKLLLGETNHGLANMLNRAFAAATGELWVLQAGDDYSREDRIEKVLAAYEASGRRARSICSNAEVIDATGKNEGLYFPANHRESYRLEVLASGNNGVLGATQVIHREVWDVFGPVPTDIYQEDVILPFQAALLGSIAYIPEALVYYRHHGANVHFSGLRSKGPPTGPGARSRLEKWLVNNIALSRARITALSIAESKGLLPPSRLEQLRKISEQTLRDTEIEHVIGLSPKLDVFRLGLKALAQGMSFKRAVRILISYSYPKAYSFFLSGWLFARQLTRQGRSVFFPANLH